MAVTDYNAYNFTDLQINYTAGVVKHTHIIGWQVLILLLLIITFCQLAQLGISLFKLYRR